MTNCIVCGHGKDLHTEYQGEKLCRQGLCGCYGYVKPKTEQVK